ncbi:MAG: YhfC family intramembrane metalloprotease [Chloroflexi bacterium]|nr:YhfC family intramembrane metalloprotease [Chloroflexota bacterium]
MPENPILITLPLDGLLMIAIPIALAVAIHRRWSVRGALFGAGVVTFIASQVVHLPMLWLIGLPFQQKWVAMPPEWNLPFNVLVGGLTAGLCEETARYIAFRRFLKTTQTWEEGLMFGAGHGGIEAILLGVLVLVTFANYYTISQMDISALPEASRAGAQQLVDAINRTPPFEALLGAVERVFAICLHLAMSLLNLVAARRGKPALVGVAILWHAAVNGIALVAASLWGAVAAESVLALTAIAAVVLILRLRAVLPSSRTAP